MRRKLREIVLKHPTEGAQVFSGVSVAVWGITALLPFPALDTDIETLLGVIALICGVAVVVAALTPARQIQAALAFLISISWLGVAYWTYLWHSHALAIPVYVLFMVHSLGLYLRICHDIRHESGLSIRRHGET
jgi:uncharacterized membrane protein HdeD (DUF308 family)